jgi:hypothetical protein
MAQRGPVAPWRSQGPVGYYSWGPRIRPRRVSPLAITDAALRADGLTPAPIVELVGAGYTEAKPQTMRAAGKTFAFMRFVITGAGRRAIG